MKETIKKNSLFGLLFITGFAALGYEMIFIRLFSFLIGNETVVTSGSISGFFLGIILGGFLFSKHSSSTNRPLFWFSFFEITAAIYTITFVYYSTPLIEGLTNGSLHHNFLLAFGLSCLFLIPCTIPLGASFAYAVAAQRKSNDSPSAIGKLYASNTLGAAIGLLISSYFLIPTLGFRISAIVLTGLIILIPIVVRLSKSQFNLENNSKLERSLPNEKHFLNYSFLFLTGFISIGAEIGISHILRQNLESTFYTFANLLFAFLLFSALGAWYQQKFKSNKETNQGYALWFTLLSISIFSGLFIAQFSASILSFFGFQLGSYAKGILSEIFLASMCFGPIAFFSSILYNSFLNRLKSDKIGIGYAINSIGSALVGFIFAILWIDFISSIIFLKLLVLISISLIIFFLRKDSKKASVLSITSIFVLPLLLFFSDNEIDFDLGVVKKLYSKEGAYGTVQVFEDYKNPQQPLKYLKLNRSHGMGGGYGFVENRMGHLAHFLNDEYGNALFLGLGSAITLGTAQPYPWKSIDAVELIPEVIEGISFFENQNNHILKDKRLSLYTKDARNFARNSTKKYDLILADLFHPARDGAGALYTMEHFNNCKDILTEDGVFMQWLPLHQFDSTTLKSVVKTFTQCFPEVHAFLGHYNSANPLLGLSGSKRKLSILKEKFHQINANLPNTTKPFENYNDLIGSYVSNRDQLINWSKSAPNNSDNFPYVLFNAPKHIYKGEEKHSFENTHLLINLRSIKGAPFPIISKKNLNYWNAVGHYLKALQYSSQKNLPKMIDEMFSAYKNSSDFSPARGFLFQLVINSPSYRNSVMAILNTRDRIRMANHSLAQ